MAKTIFPGAARTYTDGQLGGPTLDIISNPSILVTVTSVVQNSPDRVGLIIFNTGANDIYISILATVSTTFGIRLPANTGAVTMNVRDDFTLPSQPWYAVASGGTSVITVVETVRSIYTPDTEK